MCMPIVGAVMSIGLSVMSAAAADSAKKADYAAKSAAWRQNVVNAQAAGRDEQRQLLTRQLQEQEKTVQKKHISMLEQAQKGALAEVQAAAGGVSGISLDNIVDDITSKSLLNRTYADMNYAYIVADTANALKATDTKIMGRINSMPSPVEPASTFLLDAASGAVGPISKLAGSNYNTM